MTRSPTIMFPIAVEPEAIREHGTDRDFATHLSIAETLLQHGILAFEGDGGEELMAATRKLDPSLAELWDKLIKGLNNINRIDRSVVPSTVTSLIDELGEEGIARHDALVLLASEDSARRHGVTYQNPFRQFGATDLAVPGAVKLCPVATSAASLKSFEPETPREVVANSILKPLSQRSGTTTLFDPYLFFDVLRERKPSHRDHVEWLAKVLTSALPPGALLRLVGNVPDPPPRELALEKNVIMQLIESAIRKAANSRRDMLNVQVTLYQGTAEGVRAHNRYLDFDCGFTFEVTADFARLGSAVNPGPDALTFHRLDDAQAARARQIVSNYVDYEYKNALVQWEFSLP